MNNLGGDSFDDGVARESIKPELASQPVQLNFKRTDTPLYYDKIQASARVVEYKDVHGQTCHAHISADGKITLLDDYHYEDNVALAEALPDLVKLHMNSVSLTDCLPVTRINEPKWKIPGPPTKARHGYR